MAWRHGFLAIHSYLCGDDRFSRVMGYAPGGEPRREWDAAARVVGERPF